MIEIEAKTTPEIKKYYKTLISNTNKMVEIARKAKTKGFDIKSDIETVPVQDLAGRAEAIIGPPGIAKRYRKVLIEQKGDRLKTIFQIFKEIIEQEWYEIPDMSKRVEQAIKTALVLNTEGVVVAPLDGVPKVIISKNLDGSKYIDIYFAGPIRAAGGTSTVLPLILGDYARELLGLDRYKPTEEEIERYVEETTIYEEIFSRQYKLTDDEVRKIIRGCKVCVNGEPTEEREVSNHRDLQRVPTNRIRGGMCLVVSEGVALKAKKIMKWADMLNLDWSWLEGIIKFKKSGEKIELKPNPKYLQGAMAGRPIFSYPSKPGGFRLRYGRARNMGIMGKAIHPATMYILDEFIAIGTQLKVERPGKSAGITSCDSIDGPIVKLINGDVVRIETIEDAKKLFPQTKEILFLGDMLISFGDFKYDGHPLIPAGYCEEWWVKEAENAGARIENYKNISFKTAIKLSKEKKIPLYPKYTAFFSLLSVNEIGILSKAIISAEAKNENLLIENSETIKRIMEKAGMPHLLRENKLVIEKEFAESFGLLFGRNGIKDKNFLNSENSLQAIEKISGIKIRNKTGSWIGSRMGRPEAAGPRKMKGNPHALFPIGDYGGSIRSINKAIANSQNGQIEVNASLYLDEIGEEKSIFPYSSLNKKRNKKIMICAECGTETSKEKCQKCGSEKIKGFAKIKINLSQIIDRASANLGIKTPELIKGVQAMVNEQKIIEPIEKGILRARHDLHVFKDGTIRFEAINNPLTHFKPSEIGTSIEKLKELGYSVDIEGNPIKSDEQIIELFPQDVIVHKESGDFFLKITKFIDDELRLFYGLNPYYNASTRQDLIGELFLGLAPHTSAAIVARLIGYTKGRGCFAHPYFHVTKRRNCLIGETPILVETENKIKLLEIKKLDTGEKKEEIPLENTNTFSVDENGKIIKRKVTALFKQKSPKKLLKIKTKFGRQLTVTPKQKILVENNGKAIWKYAKDLKEKEQLLSLNNFEIKNEKQKLNILEWYLENYSNKEKKKLRIHNVKNKLEKIIKKHGGCWKVSDKIKWKTGKSIHTAIWFDSIPMDLFEKLLKQLNINIDEFKNAEISYNKQKSRIPAIIKLDKNLGKLIGYYLGDGYSRTTYKKDRKKYVYQVNFVSAEKQISKFIEKEILKVFNRNCSITNQKSVEILTLSGRIYYDFFTQIIGQEKTAKNKRAHKMIEFNKEFIKGLIAGHVVADGHIDLNCIKAYSVNKSLMNDFSLLLARLGIFAHLFEESEGEIKTGIIHKFYADRSKNIKIKSFGYRLYSEDFKLIGKELFGNKRTQALSHLKKHNFTKKRVKKLGNFVLDEISEIKEIKSNKKFVYDLIVEKEKTFIGGFGNLAIFDCDGDQDSLMLLMDGLLNFSQEYLPAHRGGRMDAPLVFTVMLNPQEIDEEVYNMEIVKEYPLEFYELTQKIVMPDYDKIETVNERIGKENQYSGFNFTHDTSSFNLGPEFSKYVVLDSMESKIKSQAKLQYKIKAVEGKDSLERVIITHFIPDIIGNTRSFSRQEFRCTSCNTKYRRIPLSGKCINCGKEKIILTIHQGSVRKYLDIAMEIINEYNLSNYLKQRLKLVGEEIDSIFKNDSVTQKSLDDFM